MARHQTRKTVSLNGSVFRRLKARTIERNVSVSSVVTDLVLRWLDDERLDPTPASKCTPLRDPVIARERATLLARVAAAPGPRLSRAIEISDGTASMIDDIVVRHRELHGRDVTPSEILDDAIVRFLNAVGAP